MSGTIKPSPAWDTVLRELKVKLALQNAQRAVDDDADEVSKKLMHSGLQRSIEHAVSALHEHACAVLHMQKLLNSVSKQSSLRTHVLPKLKAEYASMRDRQDALCAVLMLARIEDQRVDSISAALEQLGQRWWYSPLQTILQQVQEAHAVLRYSKECNQNI